VKNCLTYAVGMWLRYGGYLLIRKSRFVEEFGAVSRWHPAHLVPHFLHRSKDHMITQYTVTEEARIASRGHSGFRKWLKLWHFEGVIMGDDERVSSE